MKFYTAKEIALIWGVSKQLLSTILSACKDFDDLFSLVEEKLPAVEMVRKATMERLGRFQKQDIR